MNFLFFFQKNIATMYLNVTVIIIEIYDDGSRYLGTRDFYDPSMDHH